jgi:hypothetical protein
MIDTATNSEGQQRDPRVPVFFAQWIFIYRQATDKEQWRTKSVTTTMVHLRAKLLTCSDILISTLYREHPARSLA